MFRRILSLDSFSSPDVIDSLFHISTRSVSRRGVAMGKNKTSIVVANDFSLLEVLGGGGTISDQMLK